jgi:hypothetical protein
MTLSGQSTPDIAVARTRDVVPAVPLEFLRFVLPVFAAIALAASFAPFPEMSGTWRLDGNFIKTYRLGVVLPWERVTYVRNGATGREQWGHDSFRGKPLAAHLAFQSLVWGAVFLLWGPVIRRWWRRRDVTRGLPAAVEQAALARWGSPGGKVTP